MTSWLQGKTVRKGGLTSSGGIISSGRVAYPASISSSSLTTSSASHSRSSTPHVQSTSTTVFGGGVKDPSGRTSEYFVSIYYNIPFFTLLTLFLESMDDQCPVCKSDRYLNPKLRLLVSSCYHKMSVSLLTSTFLPNNHQPQVRILY